MSQDWKAAAPGMFWLLVIGAALFVFGKAPSPRRKRRRKKSNKTTRSRKSSTRYKVIATGSQAAMRKTATKRGGRVAKIGDSWTVISK